MPATIVDEIRAFAQDYDRLPLLDDTQVTSIVEILAFEDEDGNWNVNTLHAGIEYSLAAASYNADDTPERARASKANAERLQRLLYSGGYYPGRFNRRVPEPPIPALTGGGTGPGGGLTQAEADRLYAALMHEHDGIKANADAIGRTNTTLTNHINMHPGSAAGGLPGAEVNRRIMVAVDAEQMARAAALVQLRDTLVAAINAKADAAHRHNAGDIDNLPAGGLTAEQARQLAANTAARHAEQDLSGLATRGQLNAHEGTTHLTETAVRRTINVEYLASLSQKGRISPANRGKAVIIDAASERGLDVMDFPEGGGGGGGLESVALPAKTSPNVRNAQTATIIWTLAEIRAVDADFAVPAATDLLTAELSDHSRFSVERASWDAANAELDVVVRLERGNNLPFTGIDVTLFVLRGAVNPYDDTGLRDLIGQLREDVDASNRIVGQHGIELNDHERQIQQLIDAALPVDHLPGTASPHIIYLTGDSVIPATEQFFTSNVGHVAVPGAADYYGVSGINNAGAPPIIQRQGSTAAASLQTRTSGLGAVYFRDGVIYVWLANARGLASQLHLSIQVGIPGRSQIIPLTATPGTTSVGGVAYKVYTAAADVSGAYGDQSTWTNIFTVRDRPAILNISIGFGRGDNLEYLEHDGGKSSPTVVRKGFYIGWPVGAGYVWRRWSPFPEVQTLASAAAITWDVDAGEQADLLLGHNTTLTLRGGYDGSTALLRVVQDATGSRTLALHAGVTRGGRAAPVLTTTAGKEDDLYFHRKGATWRYVGILKDA